MDAAATYCAVGRPRLVNRSARRTSKSIRRRGRKQTVAARRQSRYGADDRAEYQLTQPLWVIEAMLGVYANLGLFDNVDVEREA